jgi:hypothetical protein
VGQNPANIRVRPSSGSSDGSVRQLGFGGGRRVIAHYTGEAYGAAAGDKRAKHNAVDDEEDEEEAFEDGDGGSGSDQESQPQHLAHSHAPHGHVGHGDPPAAALSQPLAREPRGVLLPAAPGRLAAPGPSSAATSGRKKKGGQLS